MRMSSSSRPSRWEKHSSLVPAAASSTTRHCRARLRAHAASRAPWGSPASARSWTPSPAKAPRIPAPASPAAAGVVVVQWARPSPRCCTTLPVQRRRWIWQSCLTTTRRALTPCSRLPPRPLEAAPALVTRHPVAGSHARPLSASAASCGASLRASGRPSWRRRLAARSGRASACARPAARMLAGPDSLAVRPEAWAVASEGFA
mmetsp:Transcript_45911/g.127999  ORF Transcript_45911/g.127999 Transcript_45911/m.127999 type:complete len:204 (+) Transcript_45911:116-727(+)